MIARKLVQIKARLAPAKTLHFDPGSVAKASVANWVLSPSSATKTVRKAAARSLRFKMALLGGEYSKAPLFMHQTAPGMKMFFFTPSPPSGGRGVQKKIFIPG